MQTSSTSIDSTVSRLLYVLYESLHACDEKIQQIAAVEGIVDSAWREKRENEVKMFWE